jgi:hypothetical protein
MKRYQRIVAVALAVVMLLGPEWPTFIRSLYAQPANINPPRTTIGLKPLVDQLMAATSDTLDTDGNSLPDSVEAVIGTDPNNTDSDFDKLNDLWEINNNLDPMEPDSNFDGMPDYLEVTDVPSQDIDGDGILNAWDYDNDGDGVNDSADLSPSARTDPNDSFHFDITNDGKPAFITIQLKPSHPEYLRLYGQLWDWPDNDRTGSVQDWDDSKEDVAIFPVLQMSVNVPPTQAEVLLNGIVVDGNTISVPLIPIMEHGNTVAFAGRIPYPSTTPQNLTMDARLIWKAISYNDPNSSVLGEQTLLATYPDSFMIAGMTVEQSEGTDVGLFYSSDLNQTVAANLLMAYQFIRNSDNHVADMPAVLDANNIDVDQQLATFAHRDSAMVSIANQMIPDALDSLPADVNLPVITLFEDSVASVDLSEFDPTLSNSFNIDITAQPIMTSKTLKTNWYNTSDRQVMETGNVMANIKNLGQSDQTTYCLMTLMLYWNTGEQSLDGLGVPQTVPGSDYELVPDVVEQIGGFGLVGLELLQRGAIGLAGLKAYQSIKLLQSKGLGSAKLPDLAKLGNWGKFKTWVRQCNHVTDSSKFFKRMNVAFDALNTAAMFLDAGFAAYSLIAISQMSDLSAFALNNAVLQVTLQYYFTCMMFMIGAIPVVGWLIAIAVELSDLFGGWSDDFITWLVSCISDVDYVPTLDVDIVGDPWVTVTDQDTNGTDVGDRIEYRSRLKGSASGDPGYYSVISDSEIYPYYKIYAPAGSSSVTGYPYTRAVSTPYNTMMLPITAPQFSWNKAEGWHAYEYESGVWIEPGTGMPNFPVYVELNSVWELWYAWSWYSFVFWDWGWHHEESRQKGKTVMGGFTFYVDVMPGTLDDFVQWRGISRLDSDGDGIRNSEETGSNPWLYDSDSDGLPDKFEIDNGLNPKAHDTDGDGLIDWYEVQFGTDPTNPDTDGDGMTDYLEIAGWMIQFEYAGQTFTTRVYSDPTVPDTDSDGVNDYQEYFSGLNPRSRDTNGDGVGDTAKSPTSETTIEFVKKINLTLSREREYKGILDMTVDADGFVYVLIHDYTSVAPVVLSEIRKFDSNLNQVSSMSYPDGDGDTGLAGSMLVDNENKLLYIGHSYEATPNIGYDNPRTCVSTLPLSLGWFVGEPWAKRDEIEGPVRLVLERDTQGNIYVGRSGTWYYWDGTGRSGTVSFMDVYDSNKNRINTWGDYARNGEVNKFGTIIDIAHNPVNGLLYICDIGMVSQYRFRPDRIAVFTTDGQYVQDMPGYHKNGVNFNYYNLNSVDVDSEGYIYICDASNHRIHKLDINGMSVASCGGLGTADGQFETGPRKAVLDANKNIYVWELAGSSGDYAEHINKFRQVTTNANEPVIVIDNNPDRDGDGLLNDTETAGWNVTYTEPNGIHTIAVTSDPLLTDTDLDGLTDLQEQQLGTNPRNPDTDSDGVGDYAEVQAKTDPKNYDTDSDGLPDGTEITYGSDPNKTDTDGEGLSDKQEFQLGADPNNADTDGDGLNDADEKALNANLLSPDSDGDFMFDGQEAALGTDPNNSDSDNDGLSDGTESVIYNTDPANDDSDGDGVKDDTEMDLRLDPLSDDTDGDGIPDGTELDEGTNPFDGDSDHDGIPDDQDMNTNLPPDVSKACPSQEYLWPANGKYVPIAINGVTDPDGDTVQIAFVTVTSDEPSSSGRCSKINFKNRYDKNKSKADAYLSDDGVLYLKAERNERGNGRVYEINFMAGDGKGGVTPGKVQVKVPQCKKGNTYTCKNDGQKYEILSFLPNEAPDVTGACPSKETLWPANRKFEKITIKGVTDPEGDKVCITITDITSDEPVAFSKWDPFTPDAFVVGKDLALVRAERADNGNGRVYAITFIAKDSKGKESTGTVQVGVPRSKGQPCIDDGQNYDPLPDSVRYNLKCLWQELNWHKNKCR